MHIFVQDEYSEYFAASDKINKVSDELQDCNDMTVKPDEMEMEDFSSEEDLIFNPEDLLSPVARLEKFADSDMVCNRQLVARSILDTLQTVINNEDEVSSVISVMCKLSDDTEPGIRAELMEQMPHIAVFCREHGHILGNVIRQQLVPLIVKFLTDSNNQVRKTSHASLVFLMEHGLIDKGQLEEWICPLIAQLTDSNNVEDQRTDAVTLMCKVATLVGKETTERLLLHQFESLCSDSSFHIRKTCAYNFGEICTVVGSETIHNILLSKFCALCEDSVWGVRKACADVFMPVSCSVSMELRRNKLAPLFIGLLCDESSWVTLAAFQSLGPFISTFADPSKTGIKYTEGGVLVTIEENSACVDLEQKELTKEGCSSNCDNLDNRHYISNHELSDDCIGQVSISNNSSTGIIPDRLLASFVSSSKVNLNLVNQDSAGDNSIDVSNVENKICDIPNELNLESINRDFVIDNPTCSIDIPSSSHTSLCDLKSNISTSASAPELQCFSTFQKELNESFKERPIKESISESSLRVTAKDGHLHLFFDNENSFNHFQFWRIPIPELELNIDIEEGKATNIRVRARVHDEINRKLCSSDVNVKVSTSPTDNDSLTCVEGVASQLQNIHIGDSNSYESSPRQDLKKVQVQAACINTITDAFDTSSDGDSKSVSKVHVLNSSFNEANLTVTHGEISDITRTYMKTCNSNGNDMDMVYSSPPSLSLSSEELYSSVNDQDIVPPQLLEYYINMTKPIKSGTADNEITHHCAYSLPAVALTLGRKYWPCLKETYESLASDMQWKVRRTLAMCMHELAVILGSDLAARDLLPVFTGLLRDLDEVRIGILQHLFHFLKILKPPEQRSFLPNLVEFLKLDNNKNWRFRLSFAEQLIPTTNLYSPDDIREHLIPLAMCLVRDKVCEVRITSVKLIAVIMKRFSQSHDPSMAKWLLNDLEEKFKHAPKWLWRQIYVLLCQQFVLENSLPQEQFIQEVVPKLLSLTWDSVPNVRLVVARCLAQTLLPLGYFPSIHCSHYQLLLQVMYSLQSDIDRDVRFFAHISADAFSVLPQKMVLSV